MLSTLSAIGDLDTATKLLTGGLDLLGIGAKTAVGYGALKTAQ
ncbi:MAG: hypothetical protein R2762_06605 [Bryobacteraceae bacterium]